MASNLCLMILLAVFITTFVSTDSQTATEKAICSYTDPEYGVSFNFYALKLLSGGQLDYYTVNDITKNADDEAAYQYFFNLCDPVLDFPDSICNKDSSGQFYSYCDPDKINTSKEIPSCLESAESRQQITSTAYAYQLKAAGDECYPLSSSVTDESNIEKSLIDPLDPTQGVEITFTNGAWADPCGANREFTVRLKCENDPATVPKQGEVDEYAPCKYVLQIDTMHGCPTGCPAYANSLCASQGLCGYDFGSNISRCFCYWGYTGSACERVDHTYDFFPTNLISKAMKAKNDPHAQTYTVTIPMTNPLTGLVEPKPVNVSYDLTKAENEETVYQINDTAETNIDYQFYFNIKGTIDSKLLPDACHKVLFPCLHDKAWCDDQIYNKNATTREYGVTDVGSMGYAFRYTDNSKYEDQEDECIMLGTKMEPMSLYDHIDNAAHGVVITYRNGSYSSDDSTEDKVVNCAITINLVCPDTRTSFFEPQKDGIILSQSEVEEIGDCHYNATYETAFACPYNCITESRGSKASEDSFGVCGGRGMCVADPGIGFVRCICDENYYENDCSKEYSTSSSSTSSSSDHHSHAGFNIAIAIISILLIGFVVAVIYLYLRNKTLEKYAVPILDEAEQVEPRVPDYSDSDSDHFHNRPKIGGAVGVNQQQEMVTVTTNLSGDTKTGKIKKMFGRDGKKKTRRKGKNKYQQQLYEDDDDYSDEDDANNGPSAYLAANQDDDDDSDDSE